MLCVGFRTKEIGSQSLKILYVKQRKPREHSFGILSLCQLLWGKEYTYFNLESLGKSKLKQDLQEKVLHSTDTSQISPAQGSPCIYDCKAVVGGLP